MKKRQIAIIAALVVFTSCVKEDFFGESEYANIKRFAVSNQSGIAIIDDQNATVTVEIPGGVDLSEITIRTLELSSFATSDKGVGDVIDLAEEATLTLTSEDGSTRRWSIEAFVASATPQLENGDLNQWYQTASNYFEPGETAATTIWGTGNRGTQLLNKLATVPEDLGDGNLAAKMETLDNGLLGGLFGTPISSGSLFTGLFNADNIDPANPEAAIEFGTPFSGRPQALRLKYSYIPGEVNKDQSGNELSYGDACDLYALLEIRSDGETERLATAWLRSEEAEEELITIEIPFDYGEPAAGVPEYTRPANNLYVSGDSADFVLPSHITFVASSSFDGANFAGAVGSTLVVDDIELIY